MSENPEHTWRFSAPWHKTSYNHFLNESLPALLAERLPLMGYSVQMDHAGEEEPHTCTVTVEISHQDGAPASGLVNVTYTCLPLPDERGVFWLEKGPAVVVPVASSELLETATVQCVGEQLYEYIAARLGKAPFGTTWDEALIRALLPLDTLFTAFFEEVAQVLDTTNWHSRHTHLRRVIIPSRKKVVAPGQMGRVDPFETPEGPYIGKVFTVALGAEIRDGKLIIFDNRPEAMLGPNAAMIPFLEHDDVNRLLMGDNMMRQGLVPPDPEPALVQTGNEPEHITHDFWVGRNLLTAFVNWGEASTEDGLVISESCARRLCFPYPADAPDAFVNLIGDKLSNRHGTKGVISQVLPDEQMPHLADGTPAEIIFSATGLAHRLNIGQVREAVMGRIARAEGRPAIVPPFHAPKEEEIRARLVQAGLPADGMERLRMGRAGKELPYTSTAGWVYWYRLAHIAREKMRVVGPEDPFDRPLEDANTPPHPVVSPRENGQPLGDMEINMLRQVGALNIALETMTTRSGRSSRRTEFASQAEMTTRSGTVFSPSPYFDLLSRRLAAAGIAAQVKNGQLTFRFYEPSGAPVGTGLRLASRRLHPWLPEHRIGWVGSPPAEAGSAAERAFATLAQANDRLERWMAAQSPKAALQTAVDQEMIRLSAYLDFLLDQEEKRLAAYFDTLLPPEAMHIFERQQYSGRAVIAPAVGLHLDQVGLPGEIIEALFTDRSKAARIPIDDLLPSSWVVITHAPAASPTALIAFHPVRVPGSSIRLHPQASALLNADFDGDQVAVFLPLSDEAQREAGEKLSIAGHLARDPDLVASLVPPHEGLWGLASLSLSAEGRFEISETLKVADSRISAPLPQTELADLLREVLDRDGIEAAMRAAEKLAHLGYAASEASGASISPFPVSQVPLPPAPPESDLAAWDWNGWYMEACREAVLSGRDYANPNLGPQLLSAAVRKRSRFALPLLVGPRGVATGADGQQVVLRHSFAEGQTPEGMFAIVAPAREALAKLGMEYDTMVQARPLGGALTILSRARHSQRPGLVFARAAESGEVDPLTDAESRILVGMPID